MSRFVVVVFETEKAAYEGSRAVLDLDREGSMALYAGAVVSSDQEGHVRFEDGIDVGCTDAAAGALLAGLIGALGGPESMIADAIGGAMPGGLGDLDNFGLDGAFLDDVGTVMEPGTYAIVLEASEARTAPFDTRMEEIGGTVFRRYRIDVEDARIERDIEVSRRDFDELIAEWDQAEGELKHKLKAKSDAARAKLQSLKDRAEKKVQSLQCIVDAKVNKLNAQIAKAKGEAKANFEKRRDEINTRYSGRMEKLRQASQMTDRALS